MARQIVKNIVKYIQPGEPPNTIAGEVWYDTTNNRILTKRSDGQWSTVSGSVGSNYGYYMGGIGSAGYLSTIDRITFPFDSGTASNVGNLNGNKIYLAGCNSSSYGFCMGGYYPTIFSIIERISFPFDSGTASIVGNLSQNKQEGVSCNSSDYGFYMGGNNGVSPYYQTVIERITFPFDSGTASAVGNLSQSKSYMAGCNSSIHGFCMGGYTGTVFLSTIDRLLFPFNSGTASTVGNLSRAAFDIAGCNSSDYGFCMGGSPSGSSTLTSTIDRILFPFDSGTASAVGNLTTSKRAVSGCNSSIYGYCMCGYSTVNYSTVDRITFPFNSGTASAVGNLTTSKYLGTSIDGTDFVTQFI